jgi:hypothetical protein
MQAFMNAVSPGYFQTMGTPFLEGRDFDRADLKPEANVAIVNRKFARHFFGEKSALGRRLGFGGGPGTKMNLVIVGVVADCLYEGPREGVRRQVFIPSRHSDGAGSPARLGALARHERSGSAARHRPGDWHSRRSRLGPVCLRAIVRHRTARPLDCRLHHSPADCRLLFPHAEPAASIRSSRCVMNSG